MFQRLIVLICFYHSLFAFGAQGLEFRFRVSQDLGSLDWGNGEITQDVVRQLMEGLTVSGAQGNPLPAIAKSWKQIKQKVVFTLRSDAKWSDGKSVCAQDFVDAWERVLDPKFASPYAGLLVDLQKATAPSCTTLVVELKREVSYFPALASHLVLLPIRKDLIAKHPTDWYRPPNLVVTGPFLLESWESDRQFILVRNRNYFGKPPAIEKISATVIQEDATALRLFESGGLDWVRDLPALELDRVRKRKEFFVAPTFVEYFLGYSFNSGLTVKQRCALNAAIDVEGLSEIFSELANPLVGILPHSLLKKRPSIQKQKMPQSVILNYYVKEAHTVLMEFLQQQFQLIGIETKLNRIEPKTYWGMLAKNPPNIFLSGITVPYADSFGFLSEFLSGSAANFGRYHSKEYDALVLKGKFHEAESLLIEKDCAILPLYSRKTAMLLSPKWTGFKMNPLTHFYLKDVQSK